MKILMVNKFLYPNGGAENYMFRLGETLTALGHEVQYFGMESENRIVGNRVGAYTENLDFHSGAKWYHAFKTIYSAEARRKIRLVLADFQPDVCHLNNFNYQLTPSVILEIRKWSDQTRHPCRIVYTAHDLQMVCPNHMCRSKDENCEACLGGNFLNCVKRSCIHGSRAKSLIGAVEGFFWRKIGVYRQIDTIVCCSRFGKAKLDTHPHLAGRTAIMYNFTAPAEKAAGKGEYVLYFGRYSSEKGIAALVQAAQELPEIPFVFAGSGPMEALLEGAPNIRNMGFQRGDALKNLIRHAKFTVCPSEVYENCPLSILESLSCGTPVLGADIGGIPELVSIKNGALFESGNREDLKRKLQQMWENPPTVTDCGFDTAESYARKVLKIYRQGM